MKINIIGQRNVLGFGTHVAGFADQLKQFTLLKEPVVEYGSPVELEALPERSRPQDINIWFTKFGTLGGRTKGRHVVWAIFEHNKLSGEYLEHLNRAQLIWTPSQWARDILVGSGLDQQKVVVVPEGVNPNVFHPYCRRHPLRKNEKFRFLAVGKYEERKGYAQLFDAFKRAFGNNPSVELIVKGDYFNDYKSKLFALQSHIKSMDCENIRMISAKWPADQVALLYNHCDAFVYPSRAEGWGLPLIEAIASGLPSLATYYSGQTEYLGHIPEHFIPLAFRLVPIRDAEFMKMSRTDGDCGTWAEVDVGDLAAKMIEIVRNQSQWKTRALAASGVMREKFTWSRAVDRAVESLLRAGLLSAPEIELTF